MPDEQVGFGPAAMENPESADFATKDESLVEGAPAALETEPVKPEQSGGKYEKLLQNVAQTTPVAPATDEEEKEDAAHIQTLDAEGAKVEQLVNLVQTKGLPHAVKVAERLKDYYALDTFHDKLVDDLYDKLLADGLITKE